MNGILFHLAFYAVLLLSGNIHLQGLVRGNLAVKNFFQDSPVAPEQRS